MKPLTIEQKSWCISVAIHVVVIVLSINSFAKQMPKKANQPLPIEVSLIAPPQPKVVAKTMVGKTGHQAIKKKPTSLPGDRNQPQTAKKADPVYPKVALNNEWQGTVKVRVQVSNTGNPIHIKVTQSSGHSSLDTAFVRAVTQYTFKPKRVMGKNVNGSIALSYTFQLGEQEWM